MFPRSSLRVARLSALLAALSSVPTRDATAPPRTWLEHGIDHLVVIGGDGSLSGTNEFRNEWAQHVAELVSEGVITQEFADAHPSLIIVGLVGSIVMTWWART